MTDADPRTQAVRARHEQWSAEQPLLVWPDSATSPGADRAYLLTRCDELAADKSSLAHLAASLKAERDELAAEVERLEASNRASDDIILEQDARIRVLEELISDAIEGVTEFETEWNRLARAALEGEK